MASDCSLFVPFTLMNTRACFMSGCTRTSLATTLPSSRGIFQFAREHGVDFVRDLLAHAFVSVIGWTHRRP